MNRGDLGGGGCFYKKGGPPDLYRVLYERHASHGRGLSFVRFGSAGFKRRRDAQSDVEDGRSQQVARVTQIPRIMRILDSSPSYLPSI